MIETPINRSRPINNTNDKITRHTLKLQYNYIVCVQKLEKILNMLSRDIEDAKMTQNELLEISVLVTYKMKQREKELDKKKHQLWDKFKHPIHAIGVSKRMDIKETEKKYVKK
jgi:hypothetical protein